MIKFEVIRENLQTIAFLAKKAIIWQFLAKNGRFFNFFKNPLGTFFYIAKALTNWKVSEKLMNGYLDNACRTYIRTYRGQLKGLPIGETKNEANIPLSIPRDLWYS